ncbi:hypothetical protein KY49_7007 [Burkholderia sp. MSHR3999]|uniref:hypothetical protein n=1 Tax=Burkholderia sp. MSHR3999 TaxID=1542965 RepID=UPI0005B6DDA1|nr:hypothetical protein [Burkholderia sp. MSHR3999]KIP17250.1 hypothetical protein KY49_7007 [Burkholderia sp. MSHR3999]
MDKQDRFSFPPPASCGPQGAEWPFYLNHRQLALLRRLHDAWGEDAIVQIYAGCVRIRSDSGDWRFSSDAELRAGLDMCARIQRK